MNPEQQRLAAARDPRTPWKKWEVATVDLDSGKEQVGVTQGGPELNPAGTSAGTHL